MEIHTRGQPAKIHKKDCKEAILFFGESLFSSRLYPKIKVTVEFINDPSFAELATCNWEDTHYKGREFIISIDYKLKPKEMLMTLAHEMVHIKQYAKGEMTDHLRADKTRWSGNWYGKKKTYDLNDAKFYWEYPWEREARAMEMELCSKFLKHKRDKGLNKHFHKHR